MSEINNLKLTEEELNSLPFLDLLSLEDDIEITEKDKNDFLDLVQSTMNKINEKSYSNKFDIDEKSFYDSEKIKTDLYQYFEDELNKTFSQISKETKKNFLEEIKNDISRFSNEIKKIIGGIKTETDKYLFQMKESKDDIKSLDESLAIMKRRISEKIQISGIKNMLQSQILCSQNLEKVAPKKDNLQKIFKIYNENGNDNITLQKKSDEVANFIIDNIYLENISNSDCNIDDKCWIKRKDTNVNFNIENEEISKEVTILKSKEKIKCQGLFVSIEMPIINTDYDLYLDIGIKKNIKNKKKNNNNESIILNEKTFRITVKIVEDEEEQKQKKKNYIFKKYESEISKYGNDLTNFIDEIKYDEAKIDEFITKKINEEKQKREEEEKQKKEEEEKKKREEDERQKREEEEKQKKEEEEKKKKREDEEKKKREEWVLLDNENNKQKNEKEELKNNNNDNVGGALTEEEIEKILQRLDDDYDYKAVNIDEEQLIKVIKDNNGDYQKISEFVEGNL